MISVIPTGIDLNKFDPEVDDRSFRQEFNISDKAIVISAIAMIRPDKGQKYLIRSVDRIVDIRPETYFLSGGSAPRKDFLYEIQAEIAPLRHRDSVILTGFRRDPQKIIAASDVIVNTSLFEPRSQVIHQAFAMKKLVIASDTGGNQESISHGQTGFLFRSESVENLSQTILTVLDHHKERIEQIRERAYQTAILEHSIDIMMEKTLNIYRKVIKTGRSLPEWQRRRYVHEELTSE
jgi:glycosyltransferase involved in cell wall biosynthesis